MSYTAVVCDRLLARPLSRRLGINVTQNHVVRKLFIHSHDQLFSTEGDSNSNPFLHFTVELFHISFLIFPSFFQAFVCLVICVQFVVREIQLRLQPREAPLYRLSDLEAAAATTAVRAEEEVPAVEVTGPQTRDPTVYFEVQGRQPAGAGWLNVSSHHPALLSLGSEEDVDKLTPGGTRRKLGTTQRKNSTHSQ